MVLCHKWDVKNDFAYVLQFFSLISDGLGSVCWFAEDAQYFGHNVHLPLHNAQYMDVVVYHCIGIKQKMHFRFNVMLRFALKDIKKWLVGNKSVFCLVISPSIN